MQSSVGLRQILAVLACLLTIAAAAPSATRPRAGGWAKYKGWRLPKTDRSKYKGRLRPPVYTPIPLGQLTETFGTVVTIASPPEEPDAAPLVNITVTDAAPSPTPEPSSPSPSPSPEPEPETEPEAPGDGGDGGIAERSVIGPDNRTLLTSSGYAAVGRILWSDGTFCTATLVGDRFVLTASHCVPWTDPSISIIFQPGFFDTEPYGHAQVTDVAYIRMNDADDFDSSPCGVYFDYAIMRLDTSMSWRVGGVVGVTQWNSTLLSTPLRHVGYPFDLAYGARPYTQTGIIGSMPSSYQCASDGPITTTADSSSGQSGGPLFLSANGSRYIVGTLSASSRNDTVFASGGGMVALVAWGKTYW